MSNVYFIEDQAGSNGLRSQPFKVPEQQEMQDRFLA
jgi:hypothetical protein